MMNDSGYTTLKIGLNRYSIRKRQIARYLDKIPKKIVNVIQIPNTKPIQLQLSLPTNISDQLIYKVNTVSSLIIDSLAKANEVDKSMK